MSEPAGVRGAASGNGFTIRPLQVADVAAARALMMRVVVEDFGDCHDPFIHADIDDLVGTYLGGGGPFLLVAIDDQTRRVVATAGIRPGALKAHRSPPDLVARYADGRTGQLVRFYTLREHRRRGIARALVDAVLRRATSEQHYDRIALHTVRHSPGALDFWLAMGAVLVADDTDGASRAVFMELPLGPASTDLRSELHATT